jgi:hypothetical protein
MTYKLDTYFNITVYLGDGLIWETRRHTFSDENVVRYTVEERRV